MLEGNSHIAKANYNLCIVRLVAALMVLEVHIGQYVGGWWEDATQFGANGVQIFFALSGFLIMYSIERCKSTKDYFLHRMIRILPLYYLVLVLRYIYDVLWYYFVEGMSFTAIFTGPCGFRYLRYFFFLQVIVPTDNLIWGNRNALWTMSSFAVFYLIAPLLYRWIKSFWSSLALLVVAVWLNPFWISAIYTLVSKYIPEPEANWFAESNPGSKLYIFLFGVTLYYAVRDRKQFLYALVLCVVLMAKSFQWHAFEVFPCCLIMMATMLPSIEVSPFIGRGIQEFGKASFALYLVHPMLLPIIRQIFIKISVSAGTQMLIYTLVSIAVSMLLYFCVVQPMETKIRVRLGMAST